MKKYLVLLLLHSLFTSIFANAVSVNAEEDTSACAAADRVS